MLRPPCPISSTRPCTLHVLLVGGVIAIGAREARCDVAGVERGEVEGAAVAPDALAKSQARVADLEQRLRRIESELASVRGSDEHRLGAFLLRRLGLGVACGFFRRVGRRAGHDLRLWLLALDRRRYGRRRRLMAAICGNFPIYSQTFVYQELVQLQKVGFEIRHSYSFPLPRGDLHAAFAALWAPRRLLVHDEAAHRRDFAWFQRRMPERTEALIHRIAAATGMPRERLVQQFDFLCAFTFARMVAAWRPQWLHSYFFYERSFHALVAGFLLGIPRGISTYADHVLADYDFKLVRLHLELCDVVVATSARIKGELLAMAPGVSPEKIVVKPNAIDSEHFPIVDRPQPGPEWPWRLTCVARIEPKKGLLHLAEAVRILVHDRGRKLAVHLIGEPDRGNEASQRYAESLAQFCERNRLWGSLHLEGRQPQTEVRRFLEGSHVFVAPFVETDSGDKDGIPTALLEAMATGIAVVTTDSGSMLEVVASGVDGLVVPQRDAVALADAVEQLMLDPERRKRLGSAAAAKVKREFDVRVCEARLHDRIEAVLATAGRVAVGSGSA